jgi:hypothetical protein
MGLFTEFVPHPAVDRLRELKLESLTPMQAFDVLRGLVEDGRPDPRTKKPGLAPGPPWSIGLGDRPPNAARRRIDR